MFLRKNMNCQILIIYFFQFIHLPEIQNFQQKKIKVNQFKKILSKNLKKKMCFWNFFHISEIQNFQKTNFEASATSMFRLWQKPLNTHEHTIFIIRFHLYLENANFAINHVNFTSAYKMIYVKIFLGINPN
jgi:hypothetical protein